MRTPIIISTFFAVILLLTACNKSKVPSDTAIQQMIVGTWRGDDVEVTFRPDFSWHDNNAQGMIDGQWRVDSGFLIMTVTKWGTAPNQNSALMNSVLRYKIISIDGQECIHGMNAVTGFPARDKMPIRWIRKMPNKSPEPTPVGAGRFAVAVLVQSRRWFSFFR